MTDLPRGYQTDWALFVDWCAATGHTALPADHTTILEFLDAGPGAPDTRRRRISAIRAVHRHRGRPTRTADTADTADTTGTTAVDAALQRISVGGWPTGVFGRRDALLLTLRYRAKLPLRELISLTSDRLELDGRVLLIRTAARLIQLEPDDDPAVCPACIWLRWSAVLRRAHLTNAALADQLRTHGPHPTLHLCKDDDTSPLTRALPVFVPIDRWGSLPLPLRPSTVRSAITLSNEHLSGRPTMHPAALTAPRAPEAPPTVKPVDHQAIHAAGLAARRQAVSELADVSSNLDDIDTSADDLDARIRRLAEMFGL